MFSLSSFVMTDLSSAPVFFLPELKSVLPVRHDRSYPIKKNEKNFSFGGGGGRLASLCPLRSHSWLMIQQRGLDESWDSLTRSQKPERDWKQNKASWAVRSTFNYDQTEGNMLNQNVTQSGMTSIFNN